jgi:hypothetical protein
MQIWSLVTLNNVNLTYYMNVYSEVNSEQLGDFLENYVVASNRVNSNAVQRSHKSRKRCCR